MMCSTRMTCTHYWFPTRNATRYHVPTQQCLYSLAHHHQQHCLRSHVAINNLTRIAIESCTNTKLYRDRCRVVSDRSQLRVAPEHWMALYRSLGSLNTPKYYRSLIASAIDCSSCDHPTQDARFSLSAYGVWSNITLTLTKHTHSLTHSLTLSMYMY
jgi:hypothetical protein